MKKFLGVFCAILITAIALAQEPESHEKTYYQAADGKLYWNKYLPFFLSISSDPNSKGVQLQSKAAKDYVNPAYFDTEGLNYIRSRYAINPVTLKPVRPELELTFDVYADGIAPKSMSKFGYATRFLKGGTIYYGGGLKVDLSAKDEMSGLKKIYYSVDGDNFMPYDSTLVLTRQGDRSIYFYAVDNVGNVEEVNKKEFVMDTEEPVTYANITGITADEIISADTRIKLQADDNLSGIKKTVFKINNGVEQIYSGGFISKNQLPDGDHTIYYYSYDNVGNKEIERKINFYLDKLPPILASDVLGDRYVSQGKTYFSGRTKLKLTAVDNKSGVSDVFYSINNEEFKTYQEPFYLPSRSGNHYIRFYAVDNMNNSTAGTNKDMPQYEHSVSKVYVDLTGPTIDIDFKGPRFVKRDTAYISPESKIFITGSDTESGLQKLTYSLNGELRETEFNAPFSLTGTGKQVVEYFGYDNVNNRNKGKAYFFVDIEGPEVFVQFSVSPFAEKNGLSVYPDYMEIYTLATDKETGNESIMYSINGSKPAPYIGKIRGFRVGAKNQVTIIAKDKVGNEASKTVEFFVDK